MTVNYKLIGIRIKEIRTQRKMSQAELAERIDMSDTYISHIETARKQASLKTMVKIANALGVTADHMLNGNQTSDPAEYIPDLAQLLTVVRAVKSELFMKSPWHSRKVCRITEYYNSKKD